MEQKIRYFFDHTTMPEDVSRRIEDAICAAPKRSGQGWRRVAAVAAVLAAALVICFRSEVTTACAEFYDHIIHTQNPEETAPLGQVDADVYISYGGLTTGPIDVLVMVENNDAAPAETRDGRLYFTANAENIDITDLCSEEESYVYVLQDNTGIWHYFIIGGTPDDWGYQIFVRDPENDFDGWVFGGGAGIVTASSDWKIREWVYDGKEKIGHPWPLVDNTLPENLVENSLPEE